MRRAEVLRHTARHARLLSAMLRLLSATEAEAAAATAEREAAAEAAEIFLAKVARTADEAC
jgi:hypothetical protein